MKTTENGIFPQSEYYIYTASTQAASAFLIPTFVGYFFYRKGYYLERARYDSFLLMFIHSGSMLVTANGREMPAVQGQVVLLDCYKPHAYQAREACEVEWLHFDGIAARGYYEIIFNQAGNIITLKDSFRFGRRLHEILTMFQNNEVIKEAVVSLKITDLLTELIVEHEAAHTQENSSFRIEEVASYITEHFSEALTLKDLAEKASLSPYYFIRQFRQLIGMTPYEFLLRTRLNAAKYLLSATDHSVKEICFGTGFENESNFCAAFKKKTGLTPMQYRKENRKV